MHFKTKLSKLFGYIYKKNATVHKGLCNVIFVRIVGVLMKQHNSEDDKILGKL